MGRRGDFTQKVKDTLAKRTNYTCSNPECKRPTAGPHSHGGKATITGEAAHIQGVKQGGARFEPALSEQGLADPHNGVWLCATCHTLVDKNPDAYSVEQLRQWKTLAEEAAGRNQEAPTQRVGVEVSRCHLLVETSSTFAHRYLAEHADGCGADAQIEFHNGTDVTLRKVNVDVFWYFDWERPRDFYRYYHLRDDKYLPVRGAASKAVVMPGQSFGLDLNTIQSALSKRLASRANTETVDLKILEGAELGLRVSATTPKRKAKPHLTVGKGLEEKVWLVMPKGADAIYGYPLKLVLSYSAVNTDYRFLLLGGFYCFAKTIETGQLIGLSACTDRFVSAAVSWSKPTPQGHWNEHELDVEQFSGKREDIPGVHYCYSCVVPKNGGPTEMGVPFAVRTSNG